MFDNQPGLSSAKQTKLNQLRDEIKNLKKVCVAYSGGVDSSLVAAIAKEQLGTNAIAVTGVSSALAPELLIEARKQALWLGIKHKECKTNEIEDPTYKNNSQNRCFACKKELHSQLKVIAKAAKGFKVIDGVNHDDLFDYRPGIKAAKEAGALSPLAKLKINKLTVREFSKALNLPWWDKPAQPCLASRFPYGESINIAGLERVAKAEEWLKKVGFKKVRVRTHGSLAKIEIPEYEIDSFLELSRKEIVSFFIEIGFTSVSLDLEGLISGKLNREDNA